MEGLHIGCMEDLATLWTNVAHTSVDGTHDWKDIVRVQHTNEVQLSETLEAKHYHEKLAKVVLWCLGKVVLKEHGSHEREESKE